MPASDHRRLVCTVGWQAQVGATVAREPVSCLVRAVFADGYEAEVVATASAWSAEAVHVYFPHPDPAAGTAAYRVWVPVDHVRRLPPEPACSA